MEHAALWQITTLAVFIFAFMVGAGIVSWCLFIEFMEWRLRKMHRLLAELESASQTASFHELLSNPVALEQIRRKYSSDHHTFPFEA